MPRAPPMRSTGLRGARGRWGGGCERVGHRERRGDRGRVGQRESRGGGGRGRLRRRSCLGRPSQSRQEAPAGARKVSIGRIGAHPAGPAEPPLAMATIDTRAVASTPPKSPTGLSLFTAPTKLPAVPLGSALASTADAQSMRAGATRTASGAVWPCGPCEKLAHNESITSLRVD
eukprot:5107006-Prymnesium_polylepis.2